jgi:carbonic anhydrase
MLLNRNKKVSGKEAVLMLKKGNNAYMDNERNSADVSKTVRENTASSGQKPYAAIVSCSDSRVPPEHIFSAGIGELFVVRTAGNVIGDFELGSIEYCVKHLQTELVVVLGHNGCGAVSAAMNGYAEGYISSILNEIQAGIKGATDAAHAECLNIAHSHKKILESPVVKEAVELGKLDVMQAKYDIHTGKVDFL